VEAAEEMTARLEAFIAGEVPGAERVAVRGLRRTTGGQSRENWPFDASWSDPDGDHDLPLLLRRDPVGSVLETDRRVEHAVLAALAGSEVPAPGVRWLDPTGEHLGRPAVVMDRLDGRCDHFVLEGGSSGLPVEDRRRLAERYCAIMAAIHRFDWRSSPLGQRPDLFPVPEHPALAAVEHWADELARQQVEPHPELAEVAWWLRGHAPDPQAVVLVHGDLKPGNSLLATGPDGRCEVQVMLDWETAHLGDPLEDVGWVTNPLRRREHLIPGVWERSDLLACYEAATGFVADPAAIRFWNVLANFKLATIMLTGVRSFLDGRGERVWTSSRSLARVLLMQLEGD
jgi:aminoglycoside phosphotransferase (APT) family kinase protein